VAGRSEEKRPLSHRPFELLRDQVPQDLTSLGYDAPPKENSTQKAGKKRHKKNGGSKPSSHRPSKENEDMSQTNGTTTSRASSAKKKAASRNTSIKRSDKEPSRMAQAGEMALEVVVDDGVRPFIRGGAMAAGAVTGAVLTGNALAKTGLQVPGFSK
jgi:hypothetical protein